MRASPLLQSQSWSSAAVNMLRFSITVTAVAGLVGLAGCVKEPQSRATILRELDSGITSSNGGGESYLRN